MRQVYPSLRVWLPLDPWRRAFWGQPGGCACAVEQERAKGDTEDDDRNDRWKGAISRVHRR